MSGRELVLRTCDMRLWELTTKRPNAPLCRYWPVARATPEEASWPLSPCMTRSSSVDQSLEKSVGGEDTIVAASWLSIIIGLQMRQRWWARLISNSNYGVPRVLPWLLSLALTAHMYGVLVGAWLITLLLPSSTVPPPLLQAPGPVLL